MTEKALPSSRQGAGGTTSPQQSTFRVSKIVLTVPCPRQRARRKPRSASTSESICSTVRDGGWLTPAPRLLRHAARQKPPRNRVLLHTRRELKGEESMGGCVSPRDKGYAHIVFDCKRKKAGHSPLCYIQWHSLPIRYAFHRAASCLRLFWLPGTQTHSKPKLPVSKMLPLLLLRGTRPLHTIARLPHLSAVDVLCREALST